MLGADSFVCSACIQNKAVSEDLFHGRSAGRCDFDTAHGTRYPVILIDEAAQIFDEAFRSEYCLGGQEFAGLDSRDKPFMTQRGEPLVICVQDFMECDDQVANALIEHAPDDGVYDGEPPFYDQCSNYEMIVDAYEREQAEAEDWLDWTHREPHPFFSFGLDVRDTRERIQAMEIEDPFLCRLLFIHQVGALEKFLHETFRTLIDIDEAAKHRFVSSTDKLNGKSIRLAEVMTDPDIVETRINAHLHSMSFHHLPLVDRMFTNAFGFSIFPDADGDIERFKRIIDMRHDCVHRNGHNKATGELHVIFRKQLSDHTADIERLGTHVHECARAHQGSIESGTPLDLADVF
ncbi:hypothetical protein Mmar10_1434 [Maricaulis maris MCS10]|uniref:RiboL-PSP-HEPN domain-containing protein n=1 Tax=Maricaulis maris (strain MCS10) TaxID=394221 RepID=Q0APR1_MARMM|nr:hypothetical protein [Maricaulis maris]ABI65726.1 hypothetical protein Mmar10_1434 [Maricaulis maris MCS10]